MYKHIICISQNFDLIQRRKHRLQLIVLTFVLTSISFGGVCKSWQPGYWVQSTGDTLWGEVKWRSIDVPRKALFRDSTLKEVELRSFNTVAFVAGEDVFRRIIFSERQLGWVDTFFMEVKQNTHSIQLLYGKIMSKGCGCDGAKYTVGHKWVLLTKVNGVELVEEDRWSRITNGEALSAALLSEGYRVDPMTLEKVEDLERLLRGYTF